MQYCLILPKMKGMNNMAKKSAKIAVTYVITILATLLIIGGICYFLLDQILNPAPKEQALPSIEPVISGGDYVPSPNDSKTSLFIYDSAKSKSGSCFVIVRMIAEDQNIVIMPIPADTYAKVNGTENSIYEFYRTGGTGRAVSAAESALNIDIDYYVKLDNNSFETLIDLFGGVDFDVPYNLIYTDPATGEEIILREGESYLDSNGLKKLFTFPEYRSGEEYRAKMIGIALLDLINSNVVSGFSNHIDDYFSTVINSTIETNYTAYDFAEQSKAMKYVADSPDRIAQLVSVSGEYDENSLFVLDENFVKAVPEWLKIRSGEEEEFPY